MRLHEDKTLSADMVAGVAFCVAYLHHAGDQR